MRLHKFILGALAVLSGSVNAQTAALFLGNDNVAFAPFPPDIETAVLGFLDWSPTNTVRITVGPKTQRLVLIGRQLKGLSDSAIVVEGTNALREVYLLIERIDVEPTAALRVSAARADGLDGHPLFERKSLVNTEKQIYFAPTSAQSGLNFLACGDAALKTSAKPSNGVILADVHAGANPTTSEVDLIRNAVAKLLLKYPYDGDGRDEKVPDSFWSGDIAHWKQYWTKKADYIHYDFDFLKQSLASAKPYAEKYAKLPTAVEGRVEALSLPQCAGLAGSRVGEWIRAWEATALPSILIAAKQALDQQRFPESFKLYNFVSQYRPIVDVGVGISPEGREAIDAALEDRARFGSIFNTTVATAPPSAEFLSAGTVVNDLVSLMRAPAPTHLTTIFSSLDGLRQKGTVQVDASGNLVTVRIYGRLIVDPAVALAMSRSATSLTTDLNALEALDVSIVSAAWQEGQAAVWRVGSNLTVDLTMPRSRAALVLHQLRSLTGVPVTLRVKRSAQQRESYSEITLIVRLRSNFGVAPMRISNGQLFNSSEENVSIAFAVTRSGAGQIVLQKASSDCLIQPKQFQILAKCFAAGVTSETLTNFIFDATPPEDSTEAAYFDFVQNDLILGFSVRCELPSLHSASGMAFSSAMLTIVPTSIVGGSKLPPKMVDLRTCGQNGKRDLQWIKSNETSAWSFRISGIVSYDSTQFTVDQVYSGDGFAITSDMLSGFN